MFHIQASYPTEQAALRGQIDAHGPTGSLKCTSFPLKYTGLGLPSCNLGCSVGAADHNYQERKWTVLAFLLSANNSKQQINNNSSILSVSVHTGLWKCINVSRNWKEMASQTNVKILVCSNRCCICGHNNFNL